MDKYNSLIVEQGKRLTEYAHRNRLSVHKICEDTGVFSTSLRKHMNGLTPLPLISFIRIVDYFGGDIEYFSATDLLNDDHCRKE